MLDRVAASIWIKQWGWKYFGKGQADLGSDDPGEVPGRLHQQVDIDPGAVRASQLRKGEEQLQGRGLKGGHHNIGLVPGLLCFYLYHILLVPAYYLEQLHVDSVCTEGSL